MTVFRTEPPSFSARLAFSIENLIKQKQNMNRDRISSRCFRRNCSTKSSTLDWQKSACFHACSWWPLMGFHFERLVADTLSPLFADLSTIIDRVTFETHSDTDTSYVQVPHDSSRVTWVLSMTFEVLQYSGRLNENSAAVHRRTQCSPAICRLNGPD